MPHFHNAPINNLPYDVIREIFIHCVSTDQFRHIYARLQPMLLTQICSSWRSIALESPTLWTHLYFCLAVANSDTDGTRITPKRQIEFLQWWKGNHGLMMPHLFLTSRLKDHDVTQEYLPLEKSLDFILTYIASAQFLYMERFYWARISERIHKGDEIIFPRLHTLISCDCYHDYGESVNMHPDFFLMGRISSPSSLRYLSLSKIRFINPTIPKQWVALTHLSLRRIRISTADWFTFIRSFPKLQWGNFCINLTEPVYNINPPRCILLELADIFITFEAAEIGSHGNFLIGSFFANLSLPSLCTLSLFKKPWRNSHYIAYDEVLDILKSNPNIKTLVLGPTFLSLDYDRPRLAMPFRWMIDAEPIWDTATQLVHLHLEIDLFISAHGSKRDLDEFMTNTFLTYGRWLSLKNPICPIQKISIIDQGWFSFNDGMPDYCLASLHELSSKIPNITFELTPNSPHRNAENAWKDWI